MMIGGIVNMGRRKVEGFFLFPGAFLYYEILFKWLGGLKSGNAWATIFLALAAGGFVQAVYLLLPGGSVRFFYAMAVLMGTAFLFLTEYFVGRAFQTFMPFDSLLAGAGDAAGDFAPAIVKTLAHGWYVIALFLLPAVLYGIEKKERKKQISGKKTGTGAAAVLLTTVCCYLAGNYLAGSSAVYGEGYQFDLSARTLGLLTTLRLETARTFAGAEEERKFVAAEAENSSIKTGGLNEMNIDFLSMISSETDPVLKNLNTFLMNQQGSSKNAYTGLFRGKNLILICAEAFSHHAVSRELTPALYRMMHNGFYFSDYYQPAWGGSTSTGEYSLLLGMIPVDGVKSIRETTDHNLYLTMGNQLSRLGYYSAAYHNNSYTYYRRNETHPNFGYQAFMGMGNGMEEGVTGSWPESDREMMDFTVPLYIRRQPFSVYYMTVSGHCGYSVSGNAMSRKNQNAVQQLNASDTVKAYYASQLELEYAMESLISQLERAGILDDTVICLTSDHYPYGLEAGDTWGNDRNYLPELYGCEESEIDKFVRDKNAWILWSGCLEGELSHMAGEIAEPVYSLDILPTLSNLFGVEYDSRLLVGRDVFSDETPLVIWPDYSWKTDEAVYDASNGKITGDVSEEYADVIKTAVKNKFNLSGVMLDYDYWEYLFGRE